MVKLELFDRYTIIKALIIYCHTLETHIVENPLNTPGRKKELIQTNNNIIKGVIDRLVDK